MFQGNPDHPGLNFKPTRTNRDVYSVRVTVGYRALGVRDGGKIVWFWIGSHASYERMIAGL